MFARAETSEHSAKAETLACRTPFLPNRRTPEMQSPIRVVVADSHRLFAEALASEIGRQPGIEVAGTAVTTAELFRLASETRPRVVLSDTMLEGDGESVLDAAPKLTSRLPDLRFLFFLAPWVPEVILGEAARHAAGLLLRSEPIAAVTETIRRVADGKFRVSEEIAARLRFDAKRRRFHVKDAALLSTRQVAALRLHATRNVREVAALLHLSEKGAESQRYRLIRKLGLSDSDGLTRLAIREGLISP
jgi:DNA-binding NarL/FixJ family response regulator